MQQRACLLRDCAVYIKETNTQRKSKRSVRRSKVSYHKHIKCGSSQLMVLEARPSSKTPHIPTSSSRERPRAGRACPSSCLGEYEAEGSKGRGSEAGGGEKAGGAVASLGRTSSGRGCGCAGVGTSRGTRGGAGCDGGRRRRGGRVGSAKCLDLEGLGLGIDLQGKKYLFFNVSV